MKNTTNDVEIFSVDLDNFYQQDTVLYNIYLEHGINL